MSKPQAPQQSDPPTDELVDRQVPPVPDEDGPHDVPDDKVIEKTLPTTRPEGDGRTG